MRIKANSSTAIGVKGMPCGLFTKAVANLGQKHNLEIQLRDTFRFSKRDWSDDDEGVMCEVQSYTAARACLVSMMKWGEQKVHLWVR